MTQSQPIIQEKIILGIDPGTNVMGYGLILVEKNTPALLQYGVIHLKHLDDHALKLRRIYEKVTQIIREFSPDEMALEAPFYGKNVQSMLKLGRAQGVAMAAAFAHDIPVIEYAAKKVKQSVTGNGNASKEQVAKMIMQMLKFQTPEESLNDATDALAIALCHHYQKGAPQRSNKSWGSFLADNPDRIKKV